MKWTHYLWTGRSIIALCDVLSADGAIVLIRSSTGHWFSVKLNDRYAVAVLHCLCDYVCVCNRSSLTFTMNQDIVMCHCWSEDRCSHCPVFCFGTTETYSPLACSFSLFCKNIYLAACSQLLFSNEKWLSSFKTHVIPDTCKMVKC